MALVRMHTTYSHVERMQTEEPQGHGWFYGRRRSLIEGEIEPYWITGAHRVRTKTGLESINSFEWFGHVPIVIVKQSKGD